MKQTKQKRNQAKTQMWEWGEKGATFKKKQTPVCTPTLLQYKSGINKENKQT